jgi:hypothetical protein
MKRFLFSVVMAVAAFSVHAQTAEEIISKHIDAIGGADAWRKVNSVKMEGSLQVQGAELTVTQYVAHGKGTRQEFSVGGMTGFMIITPTAGWNFMPFQGQQSPEPMTAEDVAKSQSDMDAQGILVDYAAKGHTVEYLGKDDVDGTECFKLKVTPKGEDPETMYFDTKNYLLIRQVSKMNRNGMEMEQTTNFSNYEKLPEGILVAKSLTLPFGELIVSKITINETIDENVFKPQ